MVLGLREFLVALTAIFLTLYYYTSSRLNYWKKRGIPGPKALPLVGNFFGVFTNQSTIPETVNKIYREWKKEPFVGVFRGQTPVLLINNLDLIKNVLIKDFNVFSGRAIPIDEVLDPISAHLFALDGKRWKSLRSKLTPIFTSGKLKHMIVLMTECADHFESYLKETIVKGSVVDCHEISSKFTTDVIGSCAFGINMNALSGDDCEFQRFGKKIFQRNYTSILKVLARETAPSLARWLKLRIIADDVNSFFIESIRETMEIRKRENTVRNDLVDLLMDIQKNHDNAEYEMTESLIAAQAFVFFVAGFETSSTTISFALYELARLPDIQEKLRNEILETLKESDGQLTYEILNKMKYLEMVIQETLRKNSPVSLLERNAFQDYIIPGTDRKIEKNTKIAIPISGIHYNSEYFPKPEVFDPERFSDENKVLRHAMTHLPFGDGPKNCIGARFALYQVKIGIIKILKNFSVKPSESTVYPYKITKSSSILAAEGGINLIFEPL